MANQNFNKILAEALTKQKRITNADRIRAMTDEELAEFHGEYSCPPNYNWSGGCERNRDEYCEKCWLDWLKQEVDNG